MTIFSRNVPNEAQALAFQLGGDWCGSNVLVPCPVCQPERRHDQRALALRSEGTTLLAFCHKSGCSFRDIMKAIGLTPDYRIGSMATANKASFKQSDYEAQQITKARKLWAHSKPISGTKGEAYFRERGITCKMPPTLRWVTNIYHAPSGRWLSAVVADVSTGGIHRTFFEKSGERMKKSAKMMQGPCAGGAVSLVNVRGPLVVAEGIETALSLASGLLNHPATIWAALSTSGIKGLVLPPLPSRLTIATDGDEAGRKAGYVLAERATALGWKVSFLPAPDGQDWNDVLRTKGGVA